MEALILGHDLDTNGQNARYKAASDRFGDDPDVLKALALGFETDPAGVVGRFQIAADRFGGLRIRSANRRQTRWDTGVVAGFPVDIIWAPGDRTADRLVRSLAAEADVIHLNNSEKAAVRLGLRKPFLLHHHGSLFRMNPPRMHDIARQYRMIQAVSTIDLLQHGPEGSLHWLPSAYNVDELAARKVKRSDDRVRIVHCPSNRINKSTDLFIDVVDELRAEGLAIDLVIVEGQTHEAVLEAKAQADIVFDQLIHGYGCNSIEAWGMGVPVVTGAADPWILQRMRKEFGTLPFVSVSEASLKSQVRRLVKSLDMRAEYGARGLAHVRKYHDEKPALERLAELYNLAIRSYRSSRLPVAPVTFRNPRRRAVAYSVDGNHEIIRWQDGLRLTTTDPFVVERLREVMRSHPRWGIEELSEAIA